MQIGKLRTEEQEAENLARLKRKFYGTGEFDPASYYIDPTKAYAQKEMKPERRANWWDYDQVQPMQGE